MTLAASPLPAKSSFIFPLLWIGALICALYPVNAFQLEFFGAAVLITLLWAFLMFCRGLDGKGIAGQGVPRSPVLIAAAAFWALTGLSLFWSDAKPISVMGFCFFSVLPLSLFGGIAGGGRRYFAATARCLVPVFALLAVWAVVQFFFLNTYFLGQARHPLADPGSLGALLGLGFFCALGWVAGAETTRSRLFAAIFAGLLLCGMMSTVARGPLAALAPGLVVFTVCLWPQVKARWRQYLAIVVIGAAFFGLMHTGASKKYDLAARFSGTLQQAATETPSTNNRMAIWKAAAHMVEDHPFLGTGIGTFHLVYPQYRTAEDVDGAYLAHNDPLQFAAELGVLGPVLFYLFIVLAAIRTVKALGALKRAETDIDGRRRIVISSIFAAMVALVVHSHVNFNFYNLSTLMLTGFLLSVWFAATERAMFGEAPVREARDVASTYKFAMLLPFVMTGWLFGSIVAGEHFANKARDELFSGKTFDFADDVNRADRVSLGLNFRTYLLAVNVPMSILAVDKDTKKPFNEEHQAQLYAQVMDYADRIAAINPYEPSPAFYRGAVQALVDKKIVPEGTPSPEEFFKRALALSPSYLQARLALDDVYQNEKKSVSERIENLEQGVTFTYTTPVASDYYGRLARLYLEAKEYDKAKGLMKRMMEFQAIDQYSRQRQSTSIPQAMMGGDALMVRP